MSKSILLYFIFFLLLFCTACKKDPAIPSAQAIPVAGNYFPFDSNYTRTYLYEDFNTDNDNTLIRRDTILYKIKNNSFYGISHEIGLYVTVRKDNGNYYSKDANGSEILILKDYLPAGSVWEETNKFGGVKRYTIESINSELPVKNIVYKNVIHISEKFFNKSELLYEIQHYYAKDIGEVYGIYPYPSIVYGNLKISLLNYSNQ